MPENQKRSTNQEDGTLMPHDKEGRTVNIGDYVSIVCKVLDVSQNEDTENLIVAWPGIPNQVVVRSSEVLHVIAPEEQP